MTLNDFRGWSHLIEPWAVLAEKFGISPNQLSFLSLVFAAIAAAFYILSASNLELLYVAALMVLINAILDTIDGTLARRM